VWIIGGPQNFLRTDLAKTLMLASTGSKKNPAIVLEEFARPGLHAGIVAASRGVSILTGVFRGEKIALSRPVTR
jgi:hypothetical protein